MQTKLFNDTSTVYEHSYVSGGGTTGGPAKGGGGGGGGGGRAAASVQSGTSEGRGVQLAKVTEVVAVVEVNVDVTVVVFLYSWNETLPLLFSVKYSKIFFFLYVFSQISFTI